MSKKKGLSHDEKRKRMMEIFFEKQEFFHIKEIEKLAPKLKGITPMSVKDVLQSLVDDDMVECEKVGSSSFYWAFPSKATNSRKMKSEKLEKSIAESENDLKTTKEALDAAKKGRTDTAERSEILKELEKLRREKDSLSSELAKLKEFDPETLRRMNGEIATAKDAANRWTDNIFSLKSWIKKKFPIDEAQINKQFEIPEDLDYI